MPIKPDTSKKEKLYNPVRVLVTGFGPFSSYGENPSWLAVKVLQDAVLRNSDADGFKTPSKPRPIHVSTVQIPVVYNTVLSTIPGLHNAPPTLPSNAPAASLPPPDEGYDFILHVGVGLPGGMAVEGLAHKLGYVLSDVQGKTPEMTRHAKRGFGGPEYDPLSEELQTEIDATELVKDLKKAGVQVELSLDPGRYLCDFIYYCSLAELEKRSGDGKLRQVLFVHCPPINENLSTEQVTDALRKVILWVCARQQIAAEEA